MDNNVTFTNSQCRYAQYYAFLCRGLKNGERLVSILDAGIAGNDWEDFGFLYLGALEEYKNLSPWVKTIIRAVSDPENGVNQQVEAGKKRFLDACTKDQYVIKGQMKKVVAEYLDKEMTQAEKLLVGKLTLPDAKGVRMPITHNGHYRFAVVNPWPGAKSAESEVNSRMLVAAKDANMECVLVSNFGFVLDDTTQEATENLLDPDSVDFTISTHYDTHKAIDSFYYHTLWNPPEIPLNLRDYATRITDNYLMNDDYLIYDDGGMSDHLRCILMNKPRTLEGASAMTASFPKSCLLPPQLDDPKMFYCGMNWECVAEGYQKRHQGLFQLLDETGRVKFFGPDVVKEWGGKRPWAGYKSYQYPIPFDGFSILKEINDCGICLVLSSDIHRRAGAATNRTYEACAAGAVIISDDNPFMVRNFKDAALFIRYNRNDPEDTFNQIMQKYQWIVEHKEEALQIAKRAQEVFRKRFALDNQLIQIVQNHPMRRATIAGDLYARTEKKRVLVSYVLETRKPDEAKKAIDHVLSNIKRQIYRNIALGVAADESIAEQISEYCRRQYYATQVVPLKMYDIKKCRFMTDGQAIAAVREAIPHELFMNSNACEVWYSDHVTTLVRTLEDSGKEIAYSGRNQIGPDRYTRPEFFAQYNAVTSLYHMEYPNYFPCPGQIMFSKAAWDRIPTFMNASLDGYEHYAAMVISVFQKNESMAFSKRQSFAYHYRDEKDIDIAQVLPARMQKNLINDIAKYQVNEHANAAVEKTSDQMMERLAWFPLKKWLKMKSLRVRFARHQKSEKLREKYLIAQHDFIDHFKNQS